MTILDRFIKYVKVHTTSAEGTNRTPSTDGQFELQKILSDELRALGVSDIRATKECNLYAKIRGNTASKHKIGFIAHLDTSDQASGQSVTPIIHDYHGGDISIGNLTISERDNPDLQDYVGDKIITASGDTLLGSDDKSGIAIIMDAISRIMKDPSLPHPEIRIAFTPDEEIGEGTEYFDLKEFDADFAYTVDGGKLGEIEYENFNAAEATVEVIGKSYHPGDSFGKMKNAVLIISDFIESLPKEMTPATTQEFEGFFHANEISGSVEKASCKILLRDHDEKKLQMQKTILQELTNKLNEKYGYLAVSTLIVDKYKNMKEYILPHFHVVENAIKAFNNVGIKEEIKAIRGGTDGARLSLLGLPCPNLSTGGHNFHGPYEFVPPKSMEKMSDVLLEIMKIYS